MSKPAAIPRQGDNQKTIIVCGRAITMSKRAWSITGWSVVVASSVVGSAIVLAVLHFLGLGAAILLVIALVAFAVPYYRRTMREVRAREAEKETV